MCRTPFLLLTMIAALGLAACGGDEGEANTAEPAATTAAGCRAVPEPEPKGEQQIERPSGRLDADRTHVASVVTNCGEFEITLDVENAPKTTASFAHLAESGFYDGLIFHRVSPGFVIQGGDPLGTGTGGPGYSIEEAPPRSISYDAGVVAMAKTGDEPAGTSGSQFFVMTESSDLPADYALLGEVTSGMDVVGTIAAVETDNFEKPTEPMVIESITVEES
jgi:peptidyl-prolyl cis-trans isomerase B (cyclophilin B)